VQSRLEENRGEGVQYVGLLSAKPVEVYSFTDTDKSERTLECELIDLGYKGCTRHGRENKEQEVPKFNNADK